MSIRTKFMDFCVSEDGGVSIDWTVLTAGIAGLGLASSAVVMLGTDDLSNDIVNQMSQQTLTTSFNRAFQNVSFFDDFENGEAPGWSVGQTDESEPFYGGILGPFGGTGGGQMVHKTWTLDPDAAFAVVEFDLHAFDTWDLENMSIFLNDQLASQHSFSTHTGHKERQQQVSINDPNIRITYEDGPTGEYGYWRRGDVASHDETVRVRIEVANPGHSLKLGFGSNLNQSVEDESWAIDNVRLTSTNDVSSVN